MQAKDDLRRIKRFIAPDAPRTALAFVRRLKTYVNRLKSFPESGSVVPELNDEDIREILFGSYRIIYRIAPDEVHILTVFHSARLLDRGIII